MRDFSVRLKSFRAFEDTQAVSIRPLTFLVGENSTGKTSFLAALNYVAKIKNSVRTNRLNDEPFDLGSYEQIAHRRLDRSTSTKFVFEAEKDVVLSNDDIVLPDIFKLPNAEILESGAPRKCVLRMTFSSSAGEAQLSLVEFGVGNRTLQIRLAKKLSFRLLIGDSSYDLIDEAKFDLEKEFGSELGIHFYSMFLRGMYASEKKGDDAIKGAVESTLNYFTSFLNSLPESVFAGSPIRSTPERVYSLSEVAESSDGRNTPYRLRRAKMSNRQNWQKLRINLHKFGKVTGLFSQMDVGKLTRDEAGPFQLKFKVGERRGTIADIGYGVSQALPYVTKLIECKRGTAFFFQQPEVHLHPKAQAGFGSYLAEYIRDNRDAAVVVETHSDFIIDRIRAHVRKGGLAPSDVTIVYFESVKDHVVCHQIDLDELGNLVGEPDCYRDFFLREAALNIGIEV